MAGRTGAAHRTDGVDGGLAVFCDNGNGSADGDDHLAGPGGQTAVRHWRVCFGLFRRGGLGLVRAPEAGSRGGFRGEPGSNSQGHGMPRLFKIEELEARKRALVEQSEIYRQTLRFEAHNLRLYMAGITQKVDKVKFFNPLMVLAAPLLKSFFARKLQRSKLGLIAKGFLAWRLYR